MRSAPRCGLQFILVIVALCSVPQRGRAGGLAFIRDYATVGRVVVRVVDGRTVVVVPVAGRLRPRLSEPLRTGNRWRLDLTIEDARISIAMPKRKTAGVESLTVTEVGADVRITVIVSRLGEYGARRSEEGLLFWIDSERPPPVPASSSTPITTGSVMPARSQEPVSAPVAESGGNRVGIMALAALAAIAGLTVRRVRRSGMPAWATAAAARATPMVKAKLFGAEPETSRGSQPAPERAEPRSVPFQNAVSDPRGRSAEIGDAFRIEPETPASGIAALVATKDNAEREEQC